jgi:hypothetical protein
MTEELKNALKEKAKDIVGKVRVSVFKAIDENDLNEILGEGFPMPELKLGLVGINLGEDIASYKLVDRPNAKPLQGYQSRGAYQSERRIDEKGFELLTRHIISAYKSMIELLDAEEGTFNITRNPDSNLVDTIAEMKKVQGVFRQEELTKLLDRLLRPRTDRKLKDSAKPFAFEILGAKTVDNREMIYNHWQGVYEEFFTFTKRDDIYSQFLEEVDISDENKRKLEAIRLPVYVLKFPQINVQQFGDNKTAVGVLNDFVSSPDILGEVLTEYRQLFEQGQGTGYDDEGRPMQYMDVDEVLDEIKEEKDVDKDGDPLFLLESVKESDFFVVDEVVEGLMVIKLADLTGDRNYGAEIRKIIGELYNKFKEQVQLGVINRDEYYLPVLDSNIDIIKKFRSLGRKTPLNFEYSYLEIRFDNNLAKINFRTDDGMYSYEDICNIINKDAVDAFKTLSDMIEKQPRTFMSRKNVKALGYGGVGTDYLSGKGANITGLREESSAISNFVKSIVRIIIKPLYIDEINARFFFSKDLPEFIKSAGYTQIKDSVTKSVGRQIRTMGVSVIGPDDLKYLNNFFKSVKRFSTASLASLRTNAINASDVLIKIANLASETRKERTEYSNRIRNAMGSILFNIYEAQGVDATTINTTFMNTPIKNFEGVSESDDLILSYLMELLSDPDFERYAIREGKMQTNLMELRRTLNSGILTRLYDDEKKDKEKMSLSKSHTIATDMIRKSKGLRMYKAFMDINDIDDVDYVIDLIYKEDRVDIYAHDIETILTLNISNDTMASGVGLNPKVIYKIKGLFR